MKKLLQVVFLFLIYSNFNQQASAQDACLARSSAHIRLVGDSWAHFPAIYQVYDSALAKYGFPDYFTVSDGSVLISMTAETWWQFPLARVALETAINTDAVRPIDIVMVSLGGNDVAFKIKHGDSLNVLDNSLYTAKLFMDSIFDFLHQKYPNGQIIWQSYDYPNFNDPCIDFPWDPYCDLWRSHDYPTPFEINRFLGYISNYQDSVITAYQKPYMHFYNALGLMQWYFGQTTPLRFAPFGTYPSRTVPMPGGNINYPSPHPAMGLLGIDTYHLNPQGFTYLAEFYMRKFISNYLRKNRDTTYRSAGQTEDGWVDANGITGTGKVLVGKRNNIDTKGIFSFNTAAIPDNKNIKKASVFFKEKTLEKPYPLGNAFPQNFILDIKNGLFGNNGIERSDYSEMPSATDVACFAGRLSGNEYTLRADIHPDALKYINKTGITQFRLGISDDNLITFYNGDTTEFEGPYLDIYYDSIEIISSVKNDIAVQQSMAVFPNPATTEITIDLNSVDWKTKKSVVHIFNTQGAIVQSIAYEKLVQIGNKIDISTLPNGGYFIAIENGEKKAVGTFVKLTQ